MTNFTPFSALAGGLLIGLAAVLLLLLSGRIAGVSGIAGGLWFSARVERAWRLMFIAGLVLGAGIWFLITGHGAAQRPQFPVPLLVLSGLLVGYGTSLGGGCTSGHGVCGLARLSLRSLVATVVFLSMGIATTFVVRHFLYLA
jgi:uncharacterized membrane protein YedE/YeeE